MVLSYDPSTLICFIFTYDSFSFTVNSFYLCCILKWTVRSTLWSVSPSKECWQFCSRCVPSRFSAFASPFAFYFLCRAFILSSASCLTVQMLRTYKFYFLQFTITHIYFKFFNLYSNSLYSGSLPKYIADSRMPSGPVLNVQFLFPDLSWRALRHWFYSDDPIHYPGGYQVTNYNLMF